MLQMENGYHLYDFKGTTLREEPVEQFKQWSWRPRPERLLSKDEQKAVRRNLREYSRQFEEQDQARKNTANRAVIEHRRRLLDEWLAWRETTETELRDEREDLGLEKYSDEEKAASDEAEDAGDGKVVEEIIEEIVEESEEILA